MRFNLQALYFEVHFFPFHFLHSPPLEAFSRSAEAPVVPVVHQAPVPQTNKQQAVQVESKWAMSIQATTLPSPQNKLQIASVEILSSLLFLLK